MYMYALSVLDATDVMALFATNVSFVYLLSWVVLHDQFVGLRVNNFKRKPKKFQFILSLNFKIILQFKDCGCYFV